MFKVDPLFKIDIYIYLFVFQMKHPWKSSAASNVSAACVYLPYTDSCCVPQDLVKSHLMYAVREEVEVLKEQIKELFERNSVLERENAVLKSLANSEQLSQLSSQATPAATPSQQGLSHPQLQQQHPKPQQLQTPQPQTQLDAGQQPNVTSA